VNCFSASTTHAFGTGPGIEFASHTPSPSSAHTHFCPCCRPLAIPESCRTNLLFSLLCILTEQQMHLFRSLNQYVQSSTRPALHGRGGLASRVAHESVAGSTCAVMSSGKHLPQLASRRYTVIESEAFVFSRRPRTADL